MTNLDHLTKAPKYFLYIDFEGVSRCDYKELNSTKEFDAVCEAEQYVKEELENKVYMIQILVKHGKITHDEDGWKTQHYKPALENRGYTWRKATDTDFGASFTYNKKYGAFAQTWLMK